MSTLYPTRLATGLPRQRVRTGTATLWRVRGGRELWGESIVPAKLESTDVASGSDPTQRHRQRLARTIASRFEHWLAVRHDQCKQLDLGPLLMCTQQSGD